MGMDETSERPIFVADGQRSGMEVDKRRGKKIEITKINDRIGTF